MTGIRRRPTRTAVPASSSARYETRRIGDDRADQLADGAALGAALGTACRWRVGRDWRVGRGRRAATGLFRGARVRAAVRCRAERLEVRAAAPLVPVRRDLGLVERLQGQDAAPQDRLERRAHLVEPGDDRTAVGDRRERIEVGLEGSLPVGRGARRSSPGRGSRGRRARDCGSSPAGRPGRSGRRPAPRSGPRCPGRCSGCPTPGRSTCRSPCCRG